jgi:hypothetical protein
MARSGRRAKSLRARRGRCAATAAIAIEAIATYATGVSRLAIDPHLVDVLLPDLVGHDKRPSSFVLYLWLYAMTRGVGRKSAFFSYQMLTDRTGLSKRAVQRAVAHLRRRQLIKVAKSSPTAVPEYSVATPCQRG